MIGSANAVIRFMLTFDWILSVGGGLVASMTVISSKYQAITLPGSYRPLTLLRHVSESNEVEAARSKSVAAVVDAVELGVAIVSAVVLESVAHAVNEMRIHRSAMSVEE